MDVSSYLQKIGLTEKESLVYLAGLKSGPATMQQLVHGAELKRATVYDVTDSLRDQGLMKVFMKGKRRMYVAEEPGNLFSILKQKETVLNQIIGNLRALQNTAGKKPSVRIYQGIEGIKEIYKDMASRRGNLIELLSTKLPDQRIADYWAGEYIQQRMKKGNFVRIIAPDLPFYRELQLKDKYALRETKILPVKDFPSQNEIFSYRGKVAFATQEGDGSLGLVIESQDISKTVELMLGFIWNSIPSTNSRD